MIICIDFDGTLCQSKFPKLGPTMPGAIEVMKQLKADGHYLIIWTCRCGERLLEAINWLLEHDIPFDRINDHNPDNMKLYGEGGKKVYAHVYIDDKNLGGFPGWQVVLQELKKKEELYVQSKSKNSQKWL